MWEMCFSLPLYLRNSQRENVVGFCIVGFISVFESSLLSKALVMYRHKVAVNHASGTLLLLLQLQCRTDLKVGDCCPQVVTRSIT